MRMISDESSCVHQHLRMIQPRQHSAFTHCLAGGHWRWSFTIMAARLAELLPLALLLAAAGCSAAQPLRISLLTPTVPETEGNGWLQVCCTPLRPDMPMEQRT